MFYRITDVEAHLDDHTAFYSQEKKSKKRSGTQRHVSTLLIVLVLELDSTE